MTTGLNASQVDGKEAVENVEGIQSHQSMDDGRIGPSSGDEPEVL